MAQGALKKTKKVTATAQRFVPSSLKDSKSEAHF
jgi:hypothetical protein